MYPHISSYKNFLTQPLQRRLSNCLEGRDQALPRLWTLLLTICARAHSRLVAMEAAWGEEGGGGGRSGHKGDGGKRGAAGREAETEAYRSALALWTGSCAALRAGLGVVCSPLEARDMLAECLRWVEGVGSGGALFLGVHFFPRLRLACLPL